METLNLITIFLGGGVLFWLAARAYYWTADVRRDTVMALEDGGLALIHIDRDGYLTGSPNVATVLCAGGPVKTLSDFIRCCTSDSQVLFNKSIEHFTRTGQRDSWVVEMLSGTFVECVPVITNKSSGVTTLLLKECTGNQQRFLKLESESKVMKEELRRASTLLNTVNCPFWIRDKNLRIIYCNLAYTRGIEDVDMESIDGIPELSKQCLQLAEKAWEKQEEQVARIHLIMAGARRLYRVREVPIPEMEFIVGSAVDISDLEKAEHDVQDYMTAQEELLESASSAMAVYGPDTRIKFYNQAYLRMWGYDENWLDTSPKFSEVLEFLREKRRLPEEINFRAYKEQRMRLFSDLLEPREDLHFLPDGRTIRSVAIPHHLGGVLLNYEDVTDRLALERSYNTLIAVQRETIDNLHEGVVVFGEDGRVRLKNPVFLKIWNLSDTDIVDRMHVSDVLEKIKDLIITNDWDRFKKEYISRLHARNLQASRIERVDEKVLDWTMVPLPDGGSLLTYTDVTDSTLVERSLRELNDALTAADRLKSEFLANVSYELRSPLTSITGFSEMLRQNYFGDLNERQREYVENIHDSSRQLMELIDNILDLASIEAGYMTLEIHEFNIYQMLSSTMLLIQERTKHLNVHATIACKKSIGKMKGDETRLRQVIFHLLSNAVKYSRQDGTIELGAEKLPDGVRLWVKDSGFGINPDELDLVFNKFYRGKAGSGRSGTGLGLSMVKSFIDLHGGAVSIDSQPGQGTIVSCFIPDDLSFIGGTASPRLADSFETDTTPRVLQ